MLSLIELLVFIILLLLTIFYFFKPIGRIIKLIKTGHPENRTDHFFSRLTDSVSSFFLLFCSVKPERPFTGFVHFFILYGSLTFDTITVYHIFEGFNKNIHVGSLHSLIVDVFSITVILAVLFFLVKRYIARNSSYTYGTTESPIIYTLLITVTVTFLLYEGASIALHPERETMAFLGNAVAGFLPPSYMLLKVSWWIHILNVFAFILYVPRSKYMHMFMGPVNIFLKSRNSSASLKTMDLENSESFGIVNLSDMTQKDLLDGYACIDCGRCTDYCPASISGKPLSPKTIITKMRDSLSDEGLKKLKDNDYEFPPLMDYIYEDDEIWTCTTCGACMEVCPVKNEHIRKIVGLRQSRVLMESKFPAELNQFFKNLENNSNPWGFGASARGDWTDGENVRLISNSPDSEYLLWVGCAGSFDDRNKKVLQSFIKILNHANVDFAVLGNEEKCCGDPARRSGNEYLFQMMAGENLETFKKYNVKKIITICPHGYNLFKNEYPEVASKLMNYKFDAEVIHHTDMINELLENNRLKIDRSNGSQITYHDPCYLGRHNQKIDNPRKIIKKTGNKLFEMRHKKKQSLCCGAGGGLLWTEEKIGDRINHIRSDEALDTGADVVCTACPFCTIMLGDGIKDKGMEDKVSVKDLAEIVAGQLTD